MTMRELETGYKADNIRWGKIPKHLKNIEIFIEITKLLRSLSNDSIIIVEGNSDRKILEEIIDITKVKVITKNEVRRTDFKTVSGDILILTDFDREGEKISKNIEKFIMSLGVKDKRIRRELRRKLKKHIIIGGNEIYDSLSWLIKNISMDIEFLLTYPSLYIFSDNKQTWCIKNRWFI